MEDKDVVDSDSGTDNDQVINNDDFLWQYDEVDVPEAMSYIMHEVSNTNSSRQTIRPNPLTVREDTPLDIPAVCVDPPTIRADSRPRTVIQDPRTVRPNPTTIRSDSHTLRNNEPLSRPDQPRKFSTLNPPREMSMKRKRQMMYIEMQKQQKLPQDKGTAASSTTPTHPPDDAVGGRVTRASSSKKRLDTEELSGSFSPLAVSQPNRIRTKVADILRKKMPAIDEESEDDGADLYELSKKSKKANSKKSKK